MTEERYQELKAMPLREYLDTVSYAESDEFCEYQRKYHPTEVMYLETHSDDTKGYKKTRAQHESELRAKIVEILKDYPDEVLEISSHDGGCVELVINDIEFDELEIRIES